MTDDEIAELVADALVHPPRTNEGVAAMFDLAEKISPEPEFAIPRMVPNGLGSHTFNPEFVAQRLLNIARASGQPPAAVRWFRKVGRADAAEGSAVKVLYGVTCPAPVEITAQVTLLPFEALQQSEMREWIVRDHQNVIENFTVWGPRVLPPAALVRAGSLQPIFMDAGADFTASPAFSWFDELQEAALLLSLVPRALPIEAAHWLHIDDPDIARLVQIGLSRTFALDVPLNPFHQPPTIAAEHVAGLVAEYRALPKKDRDRISLAIGRLMRSRSQSKPGDRAIDVAIALEVLFMNTDRDEHSYKISLRAARLLRKDVDERRTVFAEVKSVYDLRSKLVHTGSAKGEYNVAGVRRTAHDVVESVDVLCTQAIRQFLKAGGIPADWKDLELE